MRAKQSVAAGIGVIFMAAAFSEASAEPFRVLMVNPYGRDVEPFSATAAAFRTSLVRELAKPVDFQEIPLDLARSRPEQEGPLVEFLERRIESYPIDLVVPIGGSAAQFVHRHRDRLFAETPVLVVSSELRLIPPELLENRATAVSLELSLPEIVENMLILKPETAHITAVFGSSPLERFWAEECRREFAPFMDRIEFTWTNDLSLDAMVEHCANLPPDSFVFYCLFLVDGTGVPTEKSEALRRLRVSANAPIYGIFEAEFGLGITGGRLLPTGKIGLESARMARRILLGESPSDIPGIVINISSPRYDSRELKRWQISESDLPEGASVEFRETPMWKRYFEILLAAGSFLFVQTALIVALLASRSRRRELEEAAELVAEISSGFINLPPERFDREILNSLQRLAEFLDLDLVVLWQWENRERRNFHATHVYKRPGLLLAADSLGETGGFGSADTPWALEQMMANRTISFSRLEDLPDEVGPEREFGRRAGIRSGAGVPLSTSGSLVGMLGLCTLRNRRNWPESLLERLRLIAQILTNALARSQAEHDLRDSEARLIITMQAAGAGLWEFDRKLGTLWVSEEVRELLGLSPGAKVTMEGLRERVHLDDWGLVQESIEAAAANDSLLDVKFRTRTSGDEERWVAARGRRERASSGTPDRLIGLILDVTEQRQAEDRLDQLSLVVEQSPVLVVITDVEGRILYVNARFTEVTGFTLDESLGNTPRILNSGMDPPEKFEELWRTIRDGRIWRGEFHNRRKNGELYWERAVVTPLFDRMGRVAHYLGLKEDISEQRQLEAEDLVLRSNLAHASRVTLLGQLACGLAHELGQPLGAILRNAEASEIILRQSSPDLSEIMAIIDDILGDVHRASGVIDSLRSLLKPREADRQQLPISQMVNEVVSLVGPEARAKRVRIEILSLANLPEVIADRIHVEQVLLNLLANAVDAVARCPLVQRRIQVSASVPPTDPRFVEICISDGGPGIDPNLLGRIFEPFLTSKPGGLGFGLSLARTLVEGGHGKLWAENGPDGGAQFRFTLPVAGSASAETNPE